MTNTEKWTPNLIKGRVAETIIEELFVALGFQIFNYGMEHSVPGIKNLLTGIHGNVSKTIRQMPDFVIFKDDRAHFIEVKFRSNATFNLKSIEKYGPYLFEDALFVVVTKKHIKCLSYHDLKEGKEITPTCRNYLGKRKEFGTDKEIIKSYCAYAIKFFQSV